MAFCGADQSRQFHIKFVDLILFIIRTRFSYRIALWCCIILGKQDDVSSLSSLFILFFIFLFPSLLNQYEGQSLIDYWFWTLTLIRENSKKKDEKKKLPIFSARFNSWTCMAITFAIVFETFYIEPVLVSISATNSQLTPQQKVAEKSFSIQI